ncbi:MAG: hypothetical protein ACR2M3_21685 [Thermomicrobiales bacterium]
MPRVKDVLLFARVVRIGLSGEGIKEAFLTAVATVRILGAQYLVIGPVVKNYGPFRLHKEAFSRKSGRVVDSSSYFIVVGELAVPLSLRFGAASDDPDGYGSISGRQGAFRKCVYVGSISIKRSTDRDLYDHVDRWLNYKDTEIACCAEQIAAASDVAARNPRRLKYYRKRMTNAKAMQKIVSDAFRLFLLEYPDAATTTKRNSTSNAREARLARKKMQRGFRFTNKILK